MGRTLGAWFNDNLVDRRPPTPAALIGWWELRAFAASEGTKVNYHGPLRCLWAAYSTRHLAAAARASRFSRLTASEHSTCTRKSPQRCRIHSFRFSGTLWKLTLWFFILFLVWETAEGLIPRLKNNFLSDWFELSVKDIRVMVIN